jgi:hypothetical protein
MGQALPFRRQNAFLPETTKTLGEAYDSAIATLQNDARSELFVRELVAKRIIHAAYVGEVIESGSVRWDCRDEVDRIIGSKDSMISRTTQTVSDSFESVVLLGLPPKDPKNDDEDNGEDEGDEEEQEEEPAIIREPEEQRRTLTSFPYGRSHEPVDCDERLNIDMPLGAKVFE